MKVFKFSFAFAIASSESAGYQQAPVIQNHHTPSSLPTPDTSNSLPAVASISPGSIHSLISEAISGGYHNYGLFQPLLIQFQSHSDGARPADPEVILISDSPEGKKFFYQSSIWLLISYLFSFSKNQIDDQQSG